MHEVGKVTHYYGKIGVAIVELSDDLGVGDKIHVEGNRVEFDQIVESMEIDRKPASAAKRGDAIGLRVAEKVNEGATVYRVDA